MQNYSAAPLWPPTHRLWNSFAKSSGLIPFPSRGQCSPPERLVTLTIASVFRAAKSAKDETGVANDPKDGSRTIRRFEQRRTPWVLKRKPEPPRGLDDI
jgi:hypothetical protein